MRTRRIIGIAVPLALLAMALLAGSILLLRLFFVAALVVSAGFIWISFNLRNLTLRTAPPPEHLQVGATFQREVMIANSSRLPRLWLKLHDNADLPGPQDTAMINIPGKDSYSWQTTFTCRRRGRFHIGPTTVTTTDPFGFFVGQSTLGEKQEITVYPATVELPFFRYASFSDFGYGSGFQSLSRISTNASSVREYASGDSLQHIHWRSTARTGNLMVKMFDADRSHNATKTAWVLLDMNEESHFGRGDYASDETAITIAASLVKKYIQDGMRVGMIAADEQKFFTEAERGEQHCWGIMDSLALMKGEWKTRLSDVVTQHLDAFRDNPMVLIVASCATPNLMEMVRQLRTRVDSVVVALLDIESYGGKQPAAEISRALVFTGAQVYTVRKGNELGTALDTKTSRLHPLQAAPR